jgi:hypothetical protein
MNRHVVAICLAMFLGAAAAAPAASQESAADILAVRNVEIQFHQAGSVLPQKNIDLMMSLFADDAVLTDTAHGNTQYKGKAEVRRYFETVAAPFRPENHWIGYTPAMRIRADVTGNHATLYFECLWMDVDKNAIGAHAFSDMTLVKSNGKWLVSTIKVGKVAQL